MRRILFGLAIAVATMAPGWARASEADDKAAAQHIATVLRDSGKMQGFSVGVKYKEGTVWLAGRVASKEQMKAALQIVSDTEGVEQIVNNMTVGASQAGPKPVPLAAAKAGVRQASATGGVQQASPTRTAKQPIARQSARRTAPAGYNQLDCPEGVGEGVADGYQGGMAGRPLPSYAPGVSPAGPISYDRPHMPNYAWPSYAAAPNYAALTYPKQYAASAFPFIGPFYPYPQVPLGWRKVSLEWDDGWWFLDFEDRNHH